MARDISEVMADFRKSHTIKPEPEAKGRDIGSVMADFRKSHPTAKPAPEPGPVTVQAPNEHRRLNRTTLLGGLQAASSFVHGGLEGLSLGFVDELGGALGAAAGHVPFLGDALGTRGQTYTEVRDALRQRFKEQGAADRAASITGNVAGGLATVAIPGLNVARGATVAQAAGRGALAGALGGIGGSEADTALGQLRDAAIGASVGGALGAGGQRLFGGAPATARDAKRILSESARGAKAKAVEKAAQAPEAVVEAVRKFKLRGALKDPERLSEKVSSALKRVGPNVGGEVLDTTDNLLGGTIPLDEVLASLNTLKASAYKTAAELPERQSIDALADAIIETYPSGQLTTNEFHQFVSRLSKKAFSGPAHTTSAPAELSREVSRHLNGMLKERVSSATRIATERGDEEALKLFAAREIALPDFQGLSRINGLIDEGAALRREIAGGVSKTPFSAEDARRFFADPKTALGAAALGGAFDLNAVAGVIGLRLATELPRVNDRAITALARRAAQGSTPAAIVEHALSLGIPRATAQTIPGLIGTDLLSSRKQ